MNAKMSWKLIANGKRSRHKKRNRELLKVDNNESATQILSGEMEGLTSSWQKLAVLAASLWLGLMVIIFIGVELRRLQSPVSGWMDKAIDLLGLN